MKFRAVVLRRAARDAEQIVQWISQRSRTGARSWNVAYEAAVHRLLENPMGYAVADDCDALDELIVRQFLFRTRRGRMYRGLFVVDGIEVRVLRICGPGQPPLAADELT
jgi:plasmid stabilization system protein ParE